MNRQSRSGAVLSEGPLMSGYLDKDVGLSADGGSMTDGTTGRLARQALPAVVMPSTMNGTHYIDPEFKSQLPRGVVVP